METVGDDIEGIDEDGRNGVGPWDDVQVSDTESAAVWKINLSVDRGDVEDTGLVSTPGG